MKQYKYDLCVVGGCGHVGLPLAIAFADAGKKVAIYDSSEKNVLTVSQGTMPFEEEGAEVLLKKNLGKNLFVFPDPAVIRESRFLIVVIGTPTDRHLNPEFTKFKALFEGIIDLIQEDQHIILRSTVFPGTTDNVRAYLKEKGKATQISFCPERILQGKAMEELRSLPQIIGAYDDASWEDAKALFLLLTPEVQRLTPLEAEISKLFTNIWRYIQFSIGNQFYQIATEHDLDFYKIYDALTYQYPRARDFARAGFAAGPCLFKDTAQMVAYTGNTFFLGNAAILLNEGLPNFIVKRLHDKHALSSKTVGILGMTFKANIDDKRDSLSYKLKNILAVEAKKVLCSDVYVHEEGFVSPEVLIRDSDIVVVGAPHREYADLRIPEEKVLVDTWNFFHRGGLF